MNAWGLLAGAIVCEVAATLSLKGAMNDSRLYFIVVAGYSASMILMTLCIRRGMPLGVAYGIWGAIGVAATAGLSFVLFGEPLTAVMLVGIVMVIGGVLLVELGSHGSRRSGVKERS